MGFKTSTKQPDGKPQVGLFDPTLKNERKSMLKMVLIVSNYQHISQRSSSHSSVSASSPSAHSHSYPVSLLPPAHERTPTLPFPVYFGAYYRQTENTYRLTCLILDLDSAASTLSNSPLSPSLATGAYTAILGPLVTAGAQRYLTTVAPNDNSTYWSLGYRFPSQEALSQFSLPLKGADGQIRYTPGVNASEWAMERVNNQDVWAVVVVNGNATMDALDAVSNGGQGYDREHSPSPVECPPLNSLFTAMGAM